MSSVPLPPDEPERLQALRRHAILDTPPEPAFDRIARLAARLLKVPIALVSFIDERRQWYKARHGVPWQQVDRELSVCTYTILTDGLTLVPDLSRDRRFAHLPAVTGPARLRFYAGVPIKSADGFSIGTLCVIDTRSRDFGPEAQEALHDLAALTADELRLRLALAEGRLAAIVSCAQDAIIGHDLEGIINSWNAAAGRLFGYGPDEIVGMPGSVLLPVDRSDEETQIVARVQRGERLEPYETVRRSKDDRLVQVSLSVSPIHDHSGRLIAVSTIARDITPRKAAEAAVHQAHEQLREQAAVLDLAPVLVRDRDNRIVLWTQGAQRLYGFSKEEALGRISHELFGTRFPAPLVQIEDALHRHGRWEGELVHRRRNGEPLVVTSQWVLHRDDTGQPIRILEANADITERKQAEQALRDSQARLEGMIDSAMDAIISIDEAQRVVLFNAAAERMFGCTALEALGQRLDRFIPANVRAAHRDHIRAFAQTEVTSRAMGRPHSLTGLRANGEAFPLEASISQTMAAGATLFTAIVRDVTERKQAEQQKNEFLALLAHELRNPLAPICSALHVMGEAAADPATVGRMRQIANRQVEHMARLLDDLLDVARISQGRFALRKEAVELGSALARAAESVRPLCDERRHELQVIRPERPLWVKADRTRLEQVLTNLLNNAAKYTDPGGQIRLSAEADDAQRAVIRVQDTGIGIAPAMMPHIFELFVQVERRLNRSAGGVGIGLSLVKRLVELHGGSVEAFSPGLGQGSELIVRLPALSGVAPVEASRALPVTDEPQDATASPTGMRVLVVDDNVDAADGLATALKLNGHAVRVAYDGPGALSLAEGFRPQAVLLDLGLPGMDGYEVARRLRDNPDLKGAWVAAVTGRGQPEDRQRSKEVGFDRHLVKPVDPDFLAQLLAQANTIDPIEEV